MTNILYKSGPTGNLVRFAHDVPQDRWEGGDLCRRPILCAPH